MICTLCRKPKENTKIINKFIKENFFGLDMSETLIAIICDDCKNKNTIYEYLYTGLEGYITLKELKSTHSSPIVGTLSMLRAVYGDKEIDNYLKQQDLKYEEDQKYFQYLFNEIRKIGGLKMCKYCEDSEQLLSRGVATQAFEQYSGDEELQVIIDRGYLRLGFTDDMGCMDHGEKIKINFCPICGKDLNGNAEFITIESLDFSVGTYNSLKRAGINLKIELEALTEEDVMKIRNINQHRLNEIKNVVNLKMA